MKLGGIYMKMVLFTQRVEIIESYKERRDCADQRIAEFISCCGYLPMPIPNNEKYIIEFIQAVKPCGIVLTGGNSLVKYGGEAPERDRVDRRLIEIAIKQNIPLYGFCRGMQSILDYFGNKLVKVENHVAQYHTIQGTAGECKVNSYHNQGCIELISTELETEYCSDDGVIEMIRHKTRPIMGTMWHPEREADFLEADILRVRQLIG